MAMTSRLLGHVAAAPCPAFGHRRGNVAAVIRSGPMYAVTSRVCGVSVVSELSLEERKKQARAWISPWLSKKAGGPPPAAAPAPPVAAKPVAAKPVAAKAPQAPASNGNGKAENGQVLVENGYIFYSEAVLKNETLPVK